MECELVLGRDDPKPIPENNNNNGVGRGTLDCLLLVALQKLRFSPEFEEDKNSDFCILIADISLKRHEAITMSCHPVLMVLYTNDAVEVRYTDGSRLHVLPCGSAFSYYSPQEAHPIHGMKTVSQRCRFVTSTYRDMVLSAIDFRNRFAERPYLCEELIEPDQVVPLYANIKEIAWPKNADKRNCEIVQDGSVRITSVDEFGSLILSSHQRDFTVCYLSLLSQEKEKNRHKNNRVKKQSTTRLSGKHNQNQSDFHNQSNHSSQSEKSHASPRSSETKDDLNISPITQASCNDSPRAMSNASGSPITPLDVVKDNEAKFRPFSTPTQELEEEPVCTPFGKTAVFRDYGLTSKGDKVRFENDSYEQCQDKGSSQENDTLTQLTQANDCRKTKHGTTKDSWKYDSKTNLSNYDSQKFDVRPVGEKNRAELNIPNYQTQTDNRTEKCNISGHTDTNSSLESRTSQDEKQSPRCNYCWVTRHMSCDECPITWSHVVKMARNVAENGPPAESIGKDPKTSENSNKGPRYVRKIKKDQCTLSDVPLPLSLTCVGQHLHKVQTKQAYDDGKNPVEDLSTFHHGRLKILLVDGVIYRIVRLPSMKVIEVYPGDGSVLVSQGPSAQFFQHIIPQEGKIVERTYSVKSPPQTASAASHSIKSLLKRAYRFLSHARQEDKTMPGSVGICCWKFEEVTLADPMPSTLLEECVIPGYGKFTALSNGQVRIVFQDRTSLDMTCDFTKRINNCLEHSGDGSLQSVVCPPSKTSGMCRLLLPNGQYQMIDVKQPGVYKRYIDMAAEWADWVNSSPSQRQLFYKNREPVNTNMSVERELQKINCFNYIIDNTVFKRDADGCEESSQNSSGACNPYSISASKPGPSILRKTDHNSNYSKPVKNSNDKKDGAESVTDFQTVNVNYVTSSQTGNLTKRLNPIGQNSQTGSESSVNHRHNPIGQHLSGSGVLSRQPYSLSSQKLQSGGRLNSLEGFNAVREALLRTSSVIKDIDHMLEKKT